MIQENNVESYIYYDDDKKLFVNVYVTRENKFCRYYVLEDKISKQISAYISIKKDLLECLESFEYLKSIILLPQIPQNVKTSLLFAAIILYAKCFTSGEGRGTSIQKDEVFKKAKPKLSDFHSQTMDLRNKYLAHAGNSQHETRAMVLILDPSEKKIERIVYAGMRLKDDDSNIDNYIELLNIVISHVSEKIEKLRIILNENVSKLDIETIYKNSKLPEKDKLVPFNISTMKN
ncbi:MAG: hypothetical protein WAT92_23165 [Saprospiraceae bacterium]